MACVRVLPPPLGPQDAHREPGYLYPGGRAAARPPELPAHRATGPGQQQGSAGTRHAREASGQTPALGTLRPRPPPHVQGSAVPSFIAVPEERPLPLDGLAWGHPSEGPREPWSDSRGTSPPHPEDTERENKPVFKHRISCLPPSTARQRPLRVHSWGKRKHWSEGDSVCLTGGVPSETAGLITTEKTLERYSPEGLTWTSPRSPHSNPPPPTELTTGRPARHPPGHPGARSRLCRSQEIGNC